MPAATESELSDDEGYCQLDEAHTMCQYKDGTGGHCPSHVCSRVFSDQSYKDKLVEKHNKYRREVAQGEVAGLPASSDMEEVQWDDRIAAVAQRSLWPQLFLLYQDREVNRFIAERQACVILSIF